MKFITKEYILECNFKKSWDMIVDKKMYEQWAKAFNEGSTYIGKMELNERITFGDGTGNGLVAIVSVFETEKIIKFTFTGEINNNEYQDIAAYSDMFEQYTYETIGNNTKMSVLISVVDEYYPMMNEMWDKAGIELIELSKN